MIDNELKVWAAGLFDGEGSALIERIGPTRKSFQVVVAVAGTNEKTISPVMEAWGGHHRKTRDMSTWSEGARRLDCTVYFNREEATRFLADIYPYLRGKRKEVIIVLQAITAQEERIKEKGLRGSSNILEPYYTRLQDIRNPPNNR